MQTRYFQGAIPLAMVNSAVGQMNRYKCLATRGMVYFVVSGGTQALVDDFGEIIYVLQPLKLRVCPKVVL